jgi:hypothetical protein
MAQMREIISNGKISTTDLENTALFLKSQRVYKVGKYVQCQQYCDRASINQLICRILDLIRPV